ncbi:hypothetical protein Plhal304r1_c008g0032261 [Plasmopara halstedii]
METLFAPLDLQLGKKLWNECSTSSAHNGPTIRLPSLFALPVSATSNSSIKITTSERSPRIVTMSDLLSSQLSPLKEKTTMRLPSICTMINHDANSRDLTHVRIHSINLDMQLQDIKTASPRQPELKLENLLADTNTKQLDNFDLAQKNRSILRFGNTQPKRNSNAKLCGMTDCMKRAKAGGFCIAHGGVTAEANAALSKDVQTPHVKMEFAGVMEANDCANLRDVKKALNLVATAGGTVVG